jgi:homoserine O-acetyltransferase
MIAHITYLSREAMAVKFGGSANRPRLVDSDFEKDTSVASYLAYQGDKFVDRFDANSYITISRAMDRFDLGDGEALARSLAPAKCRWLVISFTSDWLFPPEQSQAVVKALLDNGRTASYCNVHSSAGHDAFLLQDELDMYGGLLAGLLENARAGDGSSEEAEEDAQGQAVPHDTSIFHGRRLDYDQLEMIVAQELPGPSPSVLDLGCGGGQLLLRLKGRGWSKLLGLEIDEQAVRACVRRGIDCIHADLNEGLGMFADQQFDCVLLSRTLQAVYQVDRVVEDMLRVGRRCVVSFPNFGYLPLRKMLHDDGRAPEAAGLLRYHWHNTPNIRFFSIADFQEYCVEKSANIHRMVALNTESRQQVTDDPNRHADLAIFVISRS